MRCELDPQACGVDSRISRVHERRLVAEYTGERVGRRPRGAGSFDERSTAVLSRNWLHVTVAAGIGQIMGTRRRGLDVVMD